MNDYQYMRKNKEYAHSQKYFGALVRQTVVTDSAVSHQGACLRSKTSQDV